MVSIKFPLPSLAAGTQLETEVLRCAYSATEDGWNPYIFHEKVDGYGAALIVARTEVRFTYLVRSQQHCCMDDGWLGPEVHPPQSRVHMSEEA